MKNIITEQYNVFPKQNIKKQLINCTNAIFNSGKKYNLLPSKQYFTLLLLLLFSSINLFAYRLTNDDVTVVNGVITQCTYDINSLGNIIDIPETLDGQTITGLGNSCFSVAGKIKEVSFPATLKTIGNFVFQDHNLTHVVLPEGITSIGIYAFKGNNLETINLPNSITNIGSGAFNYNKLSEIHIPSGLTALEDVVFRYNNIKHLTIPKNITSIGQFAFGYNAITILLIPNSVTSIGFRAFEVNNIEEVDFENGCQLTQIPQDCFYVNNIKSITLPPSILVINKGAFMHNNELASVVINNELLKIGKYAFFYCGLTNINLPNSLIYIGANAFLYNPLSSIVLPNQTEGSNWIVSDGKILNNGDLISNFQNAYVVKIPYTLQDDDVSVYNGKIFSCSYTNNIENKGNVIIIPSELDEQEITGIGSSVFSNAFIQETTLPSTLKTIDYKAFNYCDLNSLIIPASVESIGERSFYENCIRTILFESESELKNIDNDAFLSNNLTNISIPSSVNRIGRRAFNYNSLTSVTFDQPSHLLSIEGEAFLNSSLNEIMLPEPEIEGYEYRGWIDGNEIIHSSANNNLVVNNFSTYYKVVLEYTLKDEDVVVVNGVIVSCSYDFTASNITIPDTLDNQLIIGIGNSVFREKGIVEINLPPHLKSIGNSAFYKNSLSKIYIPQSVVEISDNAFYENYIKTLTFGDDSHIEIIGDRAFPQNQIDTLILPNNLKHIGDGAFSGNQIKQLTIGNESELIYIGNYAFFFNQISNDISFPSMFKEIGQQAFDYNNICNVILDDNITDIGEGAFQKNTDITISPLPVPTTIPFVTWFIRWRDSDNNTIYPGYVITDFSKGYHALIDQYLHIKVKVIDDHGLPVEGAVVQFSDSTMITDLYGLDSIAPVLRGIHYYEITEEGYLPVNDSIDVQDDTYLEIILYKPHLLTINVVDKENLALKDISVSIDGQNYTTNNEGQISQIVTNGNYLCQTQEPGYSTIDTTLTVKDTDLSVTLILEKFEPPTNISLSNNTIDENKPSNTFIGNLSSEDNNSNDSHEYSLVSGTGDDDNASFTISGDQLLSKETFNFEVKSIYSIRVETEDNAGLTYSKAVTILINDVNEAPTDILLSNNQINENEPVGTLIGSLSSIDEDLNDSHTYSLVTGTGDDDNASFTISDDQLLSNEMFNFELNPT